MEIAPQSVENYGLLADFPDVAMFDFTSMFQVRKTKLRLEIFIGSWEGS